MQPKRISVDVHSPGIKKKTAKESQHNLARILYKNRYNDILHNTSIAS